MPSSLTEIKSLSALSEGDTGGEIPASYSLFTSSLNSPQTVPSTDANNKLLLFNYNFINIIISILQKPDEPLIRLGQDSESLPSSIITSFDNFESTVSYLLSNLSYSETSFFNSSSSST